MVISARAHSRPDVVVVGSGPNGLTAAVLLARAGLAVRVIEQADRPGGGCRSAEVTLPGFVHDLCSAVHPMGALSPVFRDIGLENFGLTWRSAPLSLAHPLPNGEVAVLQRSLFATAAALGHDKVKWESMMRPFADENFLRTLLQPVWHFDGGSLFTRARFGLTALRSAESVARSRFDGDAARALFAGCAAHAVMSLERAGTAAFGLVLAATAHLVDWPCAQGGSREITWSLERALESYGGEIELSTPVSSLRDLPDCDAVLFDLSPRQVAQICGEALPVGYREKLSAFRHGPGVFKVDWALSGPIPWQNAECSRAMTVHVGGSLEEILRSENDCMSGKAPAQPFVLVAQQSAFDSSRAPGGQHTGWAYCHVPNRCPEDMTARIEAQMERFAPGFRDCILARHTTNPAQLEAYNPTMFGGDMCGGQNDLRQVLFRPLPQLNPYSTPNARVFLCSSSTPPGGGVHGMCGFHAARTILQRVFQRSLEPRGSLAGSASSR